MRTLSGHLCAPDDHGRLPFHPACPICRQERLAGVLSREPIVSYRARAALAVGIVALSGAAPSAALAAEGDQEQDGTAPAAQTGGDPAESPNFDPGGDSTDLPFDASPTPEAPAPPDPGNNDTAPLDEDPATDPGAPVADPGDGSTSPVVQQPEQAPTTDPSPPAATDPQQTPNTPSPAPAPPPAAPNPAPPAAAPTVVAVRPQTPRRRKLHRESRHPVRPGSAVTTQGAAAPASALSPPVEATATQPVPSTMVAVVTGKRATPGDRSHRVLAGESLWSIASDSLGGRASPARVAREVHRLWGLNRDRIGTGDPDLLMVGTRLTLR